MTKRRELTLGFTSLLYAVSLLFILVSNFAGRTSERWRFFYAFTQQSNILVLIWLILFGISRFIKIDKMNFLTHKLTLISLTVYISITYLIVAFVLNPIYTGSWNPLKNASELWLHHLTPFVMWLFFFFVKGHGEVKPLRALYALVYPFAYVVLNLVLGFTVKYENGNPAFAYGFLNPASYGNNAFIYIIVILVLIVVFGGFTLGTTYLKNTLDNTLSEER